MNQGIIGEKEKERKNPAERLKLSQFPDSQAELEASPCPTACWERSATGL